jgi:16S rRNA (uracil1498-N3)-methyltransferase
VVEDSRERRTRLILYQSVLKADKFEWVLQKGTELGVAAFVPIISERTVAAAASKTKRARWEQIIVEATEQAGGSKIPPLAAVQTFAEALVDATARGGLALIPWEEERTQDLRPLLASHPRASPISLFIGPEGGITLSEIEQARARGVVPVTLGSRILRAETAGLVTASAIFFERGDLNAQ